MEVSGIMSERLVPGYAETSTRKRPTDPETVIVGHEEVAQAVCQGASVCRAHTTAGWLRFKVRGKKRYYFQYRPW